jgi:hypothetical protein
MVVSMKKFKHFKGGIYEFVDYATHSETNEKLVIYRDQNGNLFARPYSMFFEKVEVEGKRVSRFTEIIE